MRAPMRSCLLILVSAQVPAFLPLLHFALLGYSQPLAQWISSKG